MDAFNGELSVTELANAATMSVVDLNNFLVRLRKPIKIARMLVIRHLLRTITKLRKSKKPADVIEKKCANLLAEVQSLKHLSLTDTSKQLIANQWEERDLSRATLPKDRAIIRMAILPKCPLSDCLSEFRSNHADWKELGAFALSKYGGRRFKRRNAKAVTEQLAQKTLDKADKRAQELYESNSQRHQYNKKNSNISQEWSDTNAANIAFNGDGDELTKKIKDSKSTEKSVKRNKDAPKDSWLASVFGGSSKTLNDDDDDQKDSAVIDDGADVVICPIDTNSIGGEELSLKLTTMSQPRKNSRNVKVAATEIMEDNGEGDFFLPADAPDPGPSAINIYYKEEAVRPVEMDKPFRKETRRKPATPNFDRQGPWALKNQRFGKPVEDVVEQSSLHPSWQARLVERQRLAESSKQQAPRSHIRFEDDAA